MLVLRRGQTHVFKPLVEEALVARIAWFLRLEAPAEIQKLDNEALYETIRVGVQKGRALGLTWTSTLGGFVGCLLTVGPKFYEHPAVQAIMSEPKLSPDERFESLAARLSGEQWLEAAEIHSKEDGHGW